MAHFHSLKVPFVLLPPLNLNDPDSCPRTKPVPEFNSNPQENVVTCQTENEKKMSLASDESVQKPECNNASCGVQCSCVDSSNKRYY